MTQWVVKQGILGGFSRISSRAFFHFTFNSSSNTYLVPGSNPLEVLKSVLWFPDKEYSPPFSVYKPSTGGKQIRYHARASGSGIARYTLHYKTSRSSIPVLLCYTYGVLTSTPASSLPLRYDSSRGTGLGSRDAYCVIPRHRHSAATDLGLA